MASDAYLKIEGINGESEDERHRHWIEVQGVLYAVHQPRAEALPTTGGHTTGRADLYPINFTKLADLAEKLHELIQKPWLWGVVVHNCTSFAEEVVRAGGSKAVQYFNCPIAEPFA